MPSPREDFPHGIGRASIQTPAPLLEVGWLGYSLSGDITTRTAMRTMESRLEEIERQLKFQKGWTAFLLIGLIGLVGFGATSPIPEKIQAKQFEVVTDQGESVVSIRSWPYGGVIQVFNSSGESTTWIGHTADGNGVLTLSDREGSPAVAAGGATDSGIGYLALFGNGNRLGLKIQGGTPSGTGGLVLVFNKKGEEVARIQANSKGKGELKFYDGKPSGSATK